MKLNDNIREKLARSVMDALYPKKEEAKLMHEVENAFRKLDWPEYEKAKSLAEGYEGYEQEFRRAKITTERVEWSFKTDSYRSHSLILISERTTEKVWEIGFSNYSSLYGAGIDLSTLKGGKALIRKLEKVRAYHEEKKGTNNRLDIFFEACAKTADITATFPVLAPFVDKSVGKEEMKGGSYDADGINRALEREE